MAQMNRATVAVVAAVAVAILALGAVGLYYVTRDEESSAAQDGRAPGEGKTGESGGGISVGTSNDPTLKFLRGEGKLLVEFTEESKKLPDRLGDGDDPKKCKDVGDGFDKKFPGAKLFELRSRIPDSQLGRIVEDQIYAVSAAFSDCIERQPDASEVLGAAMEFVAEFERRVEELENGK